MASLRPLHGLTFLNTRDARGASELTRLLTQQGATVLECPTLAFQPPESWAPFDARLRALSAQDWVAFTSANAVRAVCERLRTLGRPVAELAIARLAAIGRGTARALGQEALPVALQPPHAQQEGLLTALLGALAPGERVWIPRAAKARMVLEDGLRVAGFAVDATPVYRTVTPAEGLGAARGPLLGGAVDWLAFTSASTVTNFAALLDGEAWAALRQRPPSAACIGEITAAAARGEGFTVTVVPAQPDLDGLVQAVVDYVQAHRAQRPT